MSDKNEGPTVIHTSGGSGTAWAAAVIVLIAALVGIYFFVGPASEENIRDVDVSVEVPANTETPAEPVDEPTDTGEQSSPQ